LEFSKTFFTIWLREKDFTSLISILKKAEIDGKLLELFPVNKRSLEAFESYFGDANLQEMVDFQRNQYIRTATKELKSKLKKLLENEASAQEIISSAKDCAEKHSLKDADVCLIVWSSLMKAVQWNKKDDLLAGQALSHIKAYSPVLGQFSSSRKIELELLKTIQEYCYDNMNFMKLFQKIVMLLYKTDVLGEDAIIHWFKSGHSPKGMSVFKDQMKRMIDWLEKAEEEDDEEDE